MKNNIKLRTKKPHFPNSEKKKRENFVIKLKKINIKLLNLKSRQTSTGFKT